MTDPLSVARCFVRGQEITEINALGQGLINDTFLVKTETMTFVLQRLNRLVFPSPDLIIDNLLQLNRHIRTKGARYQKLIVPELISLDKGRYLFRDQQQACWRALQYIPNCESRESICSTDEAEQAGFALAYFHIMLTGLDPCSLHDTLPGFHVTPEYYAQFQLVMDDSAVNRQTAEFEYCFEFIKNYAGKVDELEKARLSGLLPERVIHGDPKTNNFLFDKNTGTIVSLIDLDTVKPGLIHYDVGDCIRSICHIKESNRFDIELCRAVLSRYLREAGCFLTKNDYDYLYTAIELITFELGLRFFTDYLNGNLYFKVAEPEQNLVRARDQFELCADISRQKTDIECIIRQLQNTMYSMQV